MRAWAQCPRPPLCLWCEIEADPLPAERATISLGIFIAKIFANEARFRSACSCRRQQVVDGNVDGARVNCSIIAYNQAGEEIARWNLVNAWPSSVIGPVMDESGTSYMVEQVILVHEGMERIN